MRLLHCSIRRRIVMPQSWSRNMRRVRWTCRWRYVPKEQFSRTQAKRYWRVHSGWCGSMDRTAPRMSPFGTGNPLEAQPRSRAKVSSTFAVAFAKAPPRSARHPRQIQPRKSNDMSGEHFGRLIVYRRVLLRKDCPVWRSIREFTIGPVIQAVVAISRPGLEIQPRSWISGSEGSDVDRPVDGMVIYRL